MAELLVLGLGNLLLTDDGLGPAVMAELARRFVAPPDVHLLDGGTLGLALLGELSEARAAILVDAVAADAPVGTVLRLDGGDVAPAVAEKLSPHQIGVADLLDAARLLGREPPKLILLGAVPQSLELGVGCTPEVAAAIEPLVARVVEECRSLGYPLEKIGEPSGARRGSSRGGCAAEDARQMIGRRIDIRGTVQGVGFRPWVYRLAHELGVNGRVRNDARGVTIEAFADDLQPFIDRLRNEGPPASHVEDLIAREIPVESVDDFLIVGSDRGGERRLAIPADLATCDDCLREIFDPRDRRYRYPFTNCTNCGPRFTISRSVPYDRPTTTMARFRMCPECEREYHEVADRRFHAQPNACPVCGPRLQLVGFDGDPITTTAGLLLDGAIVAIKGLGGYHLACDASLPEAVARLRKRKHREAKPFAIMVRDLPAARALAEIDNSAAQLLVGPERPIVLVPRKPDCVIAHEVAPQSPLLGIMLPYTPLHHLLLAELDWPLVMTSGNLTDEPIAFADEDAQKRLSGIADHFLLHDREIAARCEDSVARVVDGKPMMLRRSRGFVPAPFPVAKSFAQPILAMGSDLKNAVAVGAGDAVWLGPHVGDVENLEALQALEDSVARLVDLLGRRPEIIAHDLHPDYHSTRWALARPGRKIGIQHHHAHVAAVMAEHRLEGPVLGLAWDGTGWGPDGTAWGGELLRCEYSRYQRLGTVRPLHLLGGEQALREPWRLALAMLDDAFPEGAPLDHFELFENVPARSIEIVRRLTGLAPSAHGVGRWFDAASSLVLGLRESRFEGEVAMRWNLVADPDEHGRYPFHLAGGEIDLRPMVRALVQDHLAGEPAPKIAARFHETLIAAAVELLWPHAWELPVVLAGGCFQNPRLAEGIAHRLRQIGRQVFLPSKIPPGDGGLALGQAVVANAIVEEESCA